VMDERKLLNVSRIIPGDWGKAESGWLAWPLLRPDRKVRKRRQDSPVPLAAFARCQ
jgi:hypothetical protein